MNMQLNYNHIVYLKYDIQQIQIMKRDIALYGDKLEDRARELLNQDNTEEESFNGPKLQRTHLPSVGKNPCSPIHSYRPTLVQTPLDTNPTHLMTTRNMVGPLLIHRENIPLSCNSIQPAKPSEDQCQKTILDEAIRKLKKEKGNIKEMSEALEKYEKEIDAQKKNEEVLVSELMKQQKLNAELSEANCELERKNAEDLQKLQRSFQAQLAEIRDQLDQSEHCAKEMKRHNQLLLEEVARNKDLESKLQILKNKETSYSKKDQEIRKLKKELSEVLENLEKQQLEILMLRKRLSEQMDSEEYRTQRVQTDIEEKDATISTLRNELGIMERSLKAMKDNYTHNQNSLEEQITYLKNEVHRRQIEATNNYKKDIEIQHLQAQNKAKTQELESVRTRYRKKISKYKNKLNSKDEENRKSFDELIRNIASVKADCDILRRENLSLKRQLPS